MVFFKYIFGAHHKDSYLAYKKECRRDMEGRYRRTHSPSAVLDKHPLQQSRALNSKSNMNIDSVDHNKESSHNVNHVPLRSCVSSTDLALGNEFNLLSTTVPFTNQELRELRAKKAASQLPKNRSDMERNQSLNDSGSCIQSLESLTETSQSSSPVYAPKYSASWNTSLDSLNMRSSYSSELSYQGKPISRTSIVSDEHKVEQNSTNNLCESLTIMTTKSSIMDCSPNITSTPNSSPKISKEEIIMHDGPVTAHLATVTEESTSSSSANESSASVKDFTLSPINPPLSKSCVISLSEKMSVQNNKSNEFSPTFSHSNISQNTSLNNYEIPPPTSQNLHKSLSNGKSPPKKPLSNENLQKSILNTSFQNVSLINNEISHKKVVNNEIPKSNNDLSQINTSLNLSQKSSFDSNVSKIYNENEEKSSKSESAARKFSSTGTSYLIFAEKIDDEHNTDKTNIVSLVYGRRPKQEEQEYNEFATNFARHIQNIGLRNLLAPEDNIKTVGCYMKNVINLEFRKDMLCLDHSSHPDLSNILSQNAENTIKSGYQDECNGNVFFKWRKSEFHLSNKGNISKQKEILLDILNRKIKMLKDEKACIEKEREQNGEFGKNVIAMVEEKAKPAESRRFRLHVEEIDKIMLLLLGLAARLAKSENSLSLLNGESIKQKEILQDKKTKLIEQFDEAKKLMESIDNRAAQVSKFLHQYLLQSEYSEYDHFIKMKVKTIMDLREVDEKLKQSEEQLSALKSATLNDLQAPKT